MSFLKSNINLDHNDLSDEELFILFRDQDDQLAFDTLYQRYRHLVLGVSMKILRNEAKSFDNTHEVFASLVAKKSNYEINNFKNWIYTFTKNHAIYLSKKETKSKSYNNKFLNSIEENVENEFENTLYNEEQQNTNIKLASALQKLPSNQKECIELFYFKSLSYKQIEEKTVYSMNEIKSYIQNGKRKLKKIL